MDIGEGVILGREGGGRVGNGLREAGRWKEGWISHLTLLLLQ